MKYLRALLGRCAFVPPASTACSEPVLASKTYQARSNQEVRDLTRVFTVRSELLYRRLRWLQNIAQRPECQKLLIAVVAGRLAAQRDNAFAADGTPTPTAGPWARQWYSDLLCLEAASGKTILNTNGVWSIFETDSGFHKVDVSVVRVSVDRLDDRTRDRIDVSDAKFSCPHSSPEGGQCMFEGHSRLSLATHIAQKHNIRDPYKHAVVTNQCPFCRSIFKNRTSARKHAQIRGTKGVCPKICRHPMAGHTTDVTRPSQLCCPFCEFVAQDLQSLHAHIVAHFTRATDVKHLRVQRGCKQTSGHKSFSFCPNAGDAEQQFTPSSLPSLPTYWWRLPPNEEVAEVAELYGSASLPAAWWRLSPEADAAECAELYPDWTPEPPKDTSCLCERIANKHPRNISKQTFLTHYFHSQAARSSTPSSSLPQAVLNGELGSRQQCGSSSAKASHRSRRGRGFGTGEATRSVSGRVGADDSFDSSCARRCLASHMDATGIVDLRRSWNPGRQGLSCGSQSSRSSTWLGQSSHPRMGFHHHDGEGRQRSPAFREGNDLDSCQLRRGSQRSGDPGDSVQHSPGLQQGMGACAVQGESRNRAGCEDRGGCVSQNGRRAKARYRP